MDGELKLDKNLVPLNYWNIEMLNEKEVFDTQKGIVRTIEVKQLEDEKIKINDIEILTNKYVFNASKNPKDKGPFPEYTLWYFEKELIKMEFKNPNDKKNIITIIRNDWSLQLQTIWITGGSSGIGFATAKEFINNNLQVVISSSNKKKLEYEKKKL